MQEAVDFAKCAITDVDADFDEDVGKVRLLHDLHVEVKGPIDSEVVASTVGIQVTILAAI